MTCPDRTELSSFSDGELLLAERVRLEAHISDCDTCQAVIDGERDLARAFGLVVCPAPEVLGCFIDETLPGAAVERVAEHLLGCEACRDVVTWTREAEQAQRRRRSTGRRKRVRVRPRRQNQGWGPMIAGIAAAAALLLLAVWPRTPGPERGHQAQLTPTPTATVTATPRRTATPRPNATAHETPTATPSGEPTPEALPDVVGTPEPRPSSTPERDEPAPQLPGTPTPAPAPSATPDDGGSRERGPDAVPGIQVEAIEGVGIEVLDPDGEAIQIAGAGELPIGSRLAAGREAASLRLGQATCFLQAEAALQVEEKGLRLVQGEVLVDTPSPEQAFACGELVVRAGEQGARFQLQAFQRHTVMFVVDGTASVEAASRKTTVQAGEVREIRGARMSAGKLDARARERATDAAIAMGVDAPRGLGVQRALVLAAALLDSESLGERARAAHLVQVVLGGAPRVARLARPLAARAEAVLAELGRSSFGPDVAAPYLLALNAQARRDGRPGRSEREQLRLLGETLLTRPVGELAASRTALFALRAAKAKLPRELGEAVQVEGPRDLARALLAKHELSGARKAALLTQIDASLAASPLEQPLDAASLLDLQDGLLLASALTPERTRRIEAHASLVTGASLELGLLLANDAAIALGGKPKPDEPASVVVHPVGDAYRVTFVYRSTRRPRPRSVFLCSSWEDWKDDATPMRRRADGSFVVTVLLPSGAHQYKLRLDNGDWEVDPRSPLNGPDGQGGQNSLLRLP